MDGERYFKVDEPTCIAFSGGRTSAYMLWRVLNANDGLPDDCVVCFQNTGKEHHKTLEFVRDCGERWGIPIVWLEYHWDSPHHVREVDFESAAREGEPFAEMLARYDKLPNPLTRFCTGKLKIQTGNNYLRHVLGWEEWDKMIGIRADEPRRATKILANPNPESQRYTNIIPLYHAKVTVQDVAEFWRNQPFDLQLPNVNGVTHLGNCDLCYLKGTKQLMSIIASEPARADWWIEQERLVKLRAGTGDGKVFRRDRPSYADMKAHAHEQVDMFGADEEMLGCFCGD